MKTHQPKGFTLVETLIATLLLGILILILGSITGILADISQDTDKAAMQFNASYYLLEDFQCDFLQAQNYRAEDSNSFMLVTSSGEINYCITDQALYRNSRNICSIISGEFIYNENSISIDLILADHSRIQTTMYLTGGTLT